jgi:alkaline phosphatase D
MMKKFIFILQLTSAFSFTNFTIAETYKIAFGSCLDQDDPQPIWNAVFNENIDSFIFLGDNVYGDIPSGKLTKMHKAYGLQKKMLPEWLLSKDINVIWDDHDFGINDGGSSYPFKMEAKELYLNFWNVPKNDIRRAREGIYTNKIIKIDDFKINIILLDTRYFRSDLDKTLEFKPVYLKNTSPEATILGADQWEWLEKTLNINADLTIVSTSIQLLATTHRFEKWSNFPKDHKRIKMLLNSLSNPVLVISGDRHQGAIYKDKNFYEITSSSLNKTISSASLVGRPKEIDSLMIGDMYSEENYGLITIDTDKNIYEIELKNLKGESVRSQSISL